MSQPDEKHLEEEEDVVAATSEEAEEGPDVEGHKWAHGAVETVSEPDKAYKAY